MHVGRQIRKRSRRLFAVVLGGSALALVVGLTLFLFTGDSLESIAEDYVRLALSLDELSEGEVDAYFGPDNLRPLGLISLTELQQRLEELYEDLAALELSAGEDRRQRLQQRFDELRAVISYLQNPESMSFAEQAGRLYGLPLEELPEETRLDDAGRVVYVERPPTEAEQRQSEILDQLRKLLPGQGSLPFRVASFQSRLLVPLDRREQVFERAVEACREASLEHWNLLEAEEMVVEWTRDVSSPWHRYQGNGTSLLQINPLSIGYIGSMLDIACHEGYPGHHVQYLLMDSRQGAIGNLPIEETLVLLRSPLAVLLEGAADYGSSLAFPVSRRLAFEKEVLFPLAGLDPDLVEDYLTIHGLLNELGASTIPTLQAYGDRQLPRAAAAVRLESESLVSGPMALLDYVDRYGAYSIGYTVAEQRLQNYIEEQASGQSDRWNVLQGILVNPGSKVSEIFTRQ